MPSNLARKSARRKQQTRLTFDPIDPDLRSSSPAANMSPANVRYALPNQRNTPSSSRNTYADENGEESSDPLSSSKKSHMVKPATKGKGKAKADGKLPFKPLPTPVKSSQMIAKGNSSFAAFESDEDQSEGDKIRAEHRKFMNSMSTNTRGASSSKRRTRPVVDLDESDGSPPEGEVDETPSKRKKGKQKDFLWSLNVSLDQEGEDTGDLPASSQRTTRSTKSSISPKSASKVNRRRQQSVTLSSDSDDELVVHAPKNSQKRKLGGPRQGVPAAGDDESDDHPIMSSSRRQRRSAVAEDDENDVYLPVISKNGKSKNQAIPVDDDSDDEDVVLSSVNKRRPRITIQEDEESDEESISSPLKKRRRPVAADSHDSDIRSSPPKRRKQVSNDEENNDSDLPSVKNITSSRIARSRSTSSSASTIPDRVTRQAKGRKHRTEREKTMELLRRKRAGENIEELTDSTEASPEPKRGAYDTNSSLEMLSNFEDESETEVVEKLKQKRKSNMNSYHLSDDSDFVVEDDDEDPLGVPLGLSDIPLQFRHAAHKPLKEHFKDAIEWMVHRKINPAFSRNDEIYLQAFMKLDAEYLGYATSKFVSTQWTAEFTRAIYARPILIERPCSEGEGYGVDGLPKCDVCNHRKHFPRFAIHFEGKAYHKSSLEEVEKGDSDDESDSDDAVSVNSKGHSLPPDDKEWFSGIVCRDNAQQAHALIHWKYALNEWVVDQLENEGYMTPEKLAEREKMKAKQRRDYANNLVDEWEQNGTIKNLYRDFKSQLEAARESKQGRWEKGRFKGFGGGDD